ncbi:Tfp pilus assembly protein PilF [Chitinophaga niastensis]|uniref:Tfp pilus assembly protein PilF n=1 Tax=Chitinophaga niastensis TaxID=536980 RepID=A0A2P8HSA3_CHINA|nr:hypothetical protein [Chitinophaga niastensis]PSL49110.1 Tfp pilus assembly protein PilF [Chitinophaga niastensis]
MHRPLVLFASLILLISSIQPTQAQQTIDRTLLMEYLQNQQYENAISYLQPKVQADDSKQLSLLGYTFYLAGKIKEAAANYEKVLQLDSNNIVAHQYLATICMQQENPLPAIAHYLRITQLQPGNANGFKQLSFACFAAQQPDTAFIWLQKAYILNPTDPKVVARLGEEWVDRKNYLRADAILSTFLRNDSLQPTVIMTAVRASFFLKDYVRCTTLGEQLMRMNIASPNTFSYVTAAYFNLKHYQQCIDLYTYLVAHKAESETIMYYAAMAYTELKKYTLSNDLLLVCINLAKSKNLDSYYSGMAVNYEGLHQFKPAVASLDTAYYLFHQPLRQYSIGRIYEVHLKNKPTATRYYKRYLQQGNPANPEEAKIYRYLRSNIEK